MLPFYTELKNLREKQGIDLQEVANRTKINMSYLEDVEKGDFSFLLHVYVRLFLRAYAVEIGADPDDALNQLEIHLSNTGESPPPQKSTVEETVEELEEDHEKRPGKSPF
ncbi:MAG: helix-turn-helix domain-containing protein, partial [Fidelibacterota bacterium]